MTASGSEESSSPHPPAMPIAAADSTSMQRRMSVVVLFRLGVDLVAHNSEVLVELDVDLVAVVERDLDFVHALFVTDLGCRHLPLTSVGECRLRRPREGSARDGGIAGVVVAHSSGDGCADPHCGCDGHSDGDQCGASFHDLNVRPTA